MADVEYDLDSPHANPQDGRPAAERAAGKAQVKARMLNRKGNIRFMTAAANAAKAITKMRGLRDKYEPGTRGYIKHDKVLTVLLKDHDYYRKELRNPTTPVLEEDRLTAERDVFPKGSKEWEQADKEIKIARERRKMQG